jgi:hypothetical protein
MKPDTLKVVNTYLCTHKTWLTHAGYFDIYMHVYAILYHFELILYNSSLIWTTNWRVRGNCLEFDESKRKAFHKRQDCQHWWMWTKKLTRVEARHVSDVCVEVIGRYSFKMIWLLFLFFVLLMGIRVIYLVCSIHKGPRKTVAKRIHPLRTGIVIGSGGHTTEILKMIQNLNSLNYSPRIYIMASTDTSSEVKIHQIEETHL